MISVTLNFLKLLGTSTAMMLLFLPAVSAMHEELDGEERHHSIVAASSSSSSSSSSVDPDLCDLKSSIVAGLIKEVEILQAHEEDYIDFFKDMITPAVIVSIRKNIEANEKILTLLRNLKIGILTENNTLAEVLMLRFTFINSRHNNSIIFNRSLSPNSSENATILYGPTDPSIYHLLTPEQQILSTKATDKYQTFNRIILDIASLVDLRTLPAKTKKLLRASPTLCSLLEDSSKGLGHPDETFMLETTEGGPMRDWEYLTTHIKNTEKIVITSYSSFRREDKEARVTPYERKLFEPTWEHPYASRELPYPDFLKPYSYLKGVAISTLSTTQEKRGGEESDPSLATSSYGGGSSSSEPPPFSLLDEDSMPTDLCVRQEAPADTSLTALGGELIPICSSVSIKDRNTLEDLFVSSFVDTTDALRLAGEQQAMAQDPDPKPVSSRERVRPRGMRMFHDTPPDTKHNDHRPLKGKHLKIQRKLFDIREFSSVRYQDFAALWRAINGSVSIKNSSSGGAHKELLDSHGKFITGIFAHGEAQTFGKRSIQYIRDALIQIGYGL